MRKDFILFACLDFDGVKLSEICEVLKSGCATTWPKTRQFEKEFFCLRWGNTDHRCQIFGHCCESGFGVVEVCLNICFEGLAVSCLLEGV